MFPEHSAFYNLDRHCHIKHSRAVVNVMLAINLRDSKKKEREREMKRKWNLVLFPSGITFIVTVIWRLFPDLNI